MGNQEKIRLKQLPDIIFFDDNNIVILTHGFLKKSQKTPKDEIQRAERYKKDYLRRKQND